MSAPAILLVEDEALVREIVALELAEAGFRVVEADDGAAALEQLDAEPALALLFTDIRLPGRLDGVGLAAESRRRRPGLPVIYATGYSPDALTLVPGARLLRKPYRFAQVLDAMAALGVAPE